MLMKLTVVGCLMVFTVLNSTPPADAIGFELLGQLSELLFGSDESDESEETVINAKPNATVTVVCMKECNLNVTCVNCNKIDTTMMKPSNGNGGGGGSKPMNGGGNGGGNGSGNGGGNGGNGGNGGGNGGNGGGNGGNGGGNGATMAPAGSTAGPATEPSMDVTTVQG